jgi:hypothetical protein
VNTERTIEAGGETMNFLSFKEYILRTLNIDYVDNDDTLQ